jgi:hypothetical protein
MMLPITVYPTAKSASQAPPPDSAHFVTYLHDAIRVGAIIDDEKTVSVGGRAATLLSLTGKPDVNLDGLLGCPNIAAALDCYGPSSDLLLRVAIVDVQGKALLIWARTDSGTSETRPSSPRSNQCLPDSRFARHPFRAPPRAHPQIQMTRFDRVPILLDQDLPVRCLVIFASSRPRVQARVRARYSC